MNPFLFVDGMDNSDAPNACHVFDVFWPTCFKSVSGFPESFETGSNFIGHKIFIDLDDYLLLQNNKTYM